MSPRSEDMAKRSNPAAAFLRPVVAFLVASAVTYFLFWRAASDRPFGDSLGSYPSWLLSSLTFGLVGGADSLASADMLARWRTTIEVAALGSILALVFAGILGFAARSNRVVGWVVGAMSTTLASLSAPVVVVTLLYWFALKLGILPFVSLASWSDSVGEHLKGLVLPSLSIALVVGPGLVGWLSPSAGSGSAAELADQPGLGMHRSRGVPFTTLFLALVVVERFFLVPGVFSIPLQGGLRGDVGPVGAVTGQLLVAGLLVSLVGVALAETTPNVDTQSRGRSPLALLVALAGLAAWVLLGLLGFLSLVIDGDADLVGANAGMFADGHLLGTDQLGRDLLGMLADGAVPSLAWPLLTGIVATLVSLVPVVVGRRLGPLSDWLISLPMQCISWPAIVVLPAILFGLRSAHGLVLALFLMAIAIPVATRLLSATGDGLSATSVAGVAFLTGGWLLAVFTAAAAVGFLPGTTGVRTSWGSQLGQSANNLVFSARPSVVLGLAILLGGMAFRLTGAGLLAHGRAEKSADLDEMSPASNQV